MAGRVRRRYRIRRRVPPVPRCPVPGGRAGGSPARTSHGWPFWGCWPGVDDILTPDLLGPDRTYERTMAGPDGVSATRTWPTEVIAAIEAAVVCGSREDGCNDGWMSGPDGQVKRLLAPMMLGKPRTLTPGEQLTIATWAAMKSMVLEYFWGRAGRRPAAGRPDVRLPPATPAREHADPDDCRGVPGPASTDLPPDVPAAAGGLRRSRTSRVCLVLDIGARLLCRPDLRDLHCSSRRFAAPARQQLLRHKPADWPGCQLATAGAARRRGPRS